MTSLSKIGVACLLSIALSTSQAFEGNKPVRIVTPSAAGTALDIIARRLADKLAENLGHPIVVENRPGANGIIAAGVVAQSPPDGLTLLMGTAGTHGINSSLFAKLAYNPEKDFEPIIALTYSANVFLVNNDSPFRTLDDLVAAAGKRPDALSMGTSGIGSTPHLSSTILNMMARTKTVHVPSQGTPIMELIGGRLDYAVDSIPVALTFISANKVRALAVTSPERSPYLPSVPTVAEAGYKDYSVIAWSALFAPAKTPASTIQAINAAVNKTLKDPTVLAGLKATSSEVLGGTPDDLRKRVDFELKRWPPIVKESGAKVE